MKEILKKIEIFKILNEEELDIVANYFHNVQIKKNELVSQFSDLQVLEKHYSELLKNELPKEEVKKEEKK